MTEPADRDSTAHFFHPRFWTATAALWTAAIFALALTPDVTGGWLMKTVGDKVLHGAAFAVGCLLWAKALRSNPRLPPMTTVIAGAFIALIIGLAVELFQSYVPGRFADPADIVANALGVIPALAYLTVAELVKRRKTA